MSINWQQYSVIAFIDSNIALATGPGPGKQGPNPRSGQLECVND